MHSGAATSNAGVVASPVGARPGRLASDRSGAVGRDLTDRLLPWAVALLTLAARLATAATGPTDWDSAQYAAGIARFDVTHGRPHPPGYFLYVVAGRLVHATGLGVIHSLVLVSAVASAAAAGLVVVAGRDLGGRWVGLAAGLLVALSPFAWFSGSIVATYSFDLVTAPLLIILAWRARPHSWHGAAAMATLGVAIGFRQSTLQSFALLALIAVVASVRRVREALLALVVGAVAVAAWFVPMALAQPGGASTWAQATHSETLGAIRSTSILDHAPGGTANLHVFARYTSTALAPLALLALASVVVLVLRAAVGRVRRRRLLATAPVRTDARAHSPGSSSGSSGDPSNPGIADPAAVTPPRDPTAGPSGSGWSRPWYQTRTAILIAAVVPSMAMVALVEFAKGGYLLAYLPGAVIALLLAPAALLRRRPGRAGSDTSAGPRTSPAWLIVLSLAVVAIAALGAQRFLLKVDFTDSRATIRSTDAIDDGLATIAPLVHPGRDVVVMDSVDGGATYYRNAGWELPLDRVALVAPGVVAYNELAGSLYYSVSTDLPVGVGGYVYLVGPASLSGIVSAGAGAQPVPVPTALPIPGYQLWRIAPGATILGVHVVVQSGVRPLGTGILG